MFDLWVFHQYWSKQTAASIKIKAFRCQHTGPCRFSKNHVHESQWINTFPIRNGCNIFRWESDDMVDRLDICIFSFFLAFRRQSQFNNSPAHLRCVHATYSIKGKWANIYCANTSRTFNYTPIPHNSHSRIMHNSLFKHLKPPHQYCIR